MLIVSKLNSFVLNVPKSLVNFDWIPSFSSSFVNFILSLLGNCFTNKPDFTPYNAVLSDIRIFDPKKAMTPLDEKFDWEAVKNSVEMDDPEEMKKERKDDGRTKVNH